MPPCTARHQKRKVLASAGITAKPLTRRSDCIVFRKMRKTSGEESTTRWMFNWLPEFSAPRTNSSCQTMNVQFSRRPIETYTKKRQKTHKTKTSIMKSLKVSPNCHRRWDKPSHRVQKRSWLRKFKICWTTSISYSSKKNRNSTSNLGARRSCRSSNG